SAPSALECFVGCFPGALPRAGSPAEQLGWGARLLHFRTFGASSDDQIGVPLMRICHAITLILVVLFAALVANSITGQDYPRRAQELKFGFTPVLSEPEMRTEFEPLMNYLSE